MRQKFSGVLTMRKDLFRTGLLSLTASALVVSSMSGDSQVKIVSASLDLETYSKVKIEFNTSLTDDGNITAIRQDMADGNFTIKNEATGDDVYLVYDRNESDKIFYFTIPDSNLSIIKGNTYNNLHIYWTDNDLNDTGTKYNTDDDTNASLLFTAEDNKTFEINVSNDAWNLITLPANTMTNARELIKANKVTMVWGWDWNGTAYNWEAYPNKMVPGRGYWVRTRVKQNTEGNLSDIMLSDYNTTVVGDYNTSVDINESNFSVVTSKIPQPEQWVLLGNSTGKDVNITADKTKENLSKGVYYFDNLLNREKNCYFISIYHWDAKNTKWVNDTVNGEGIIPKNAGVWVKQRLCDK